jgi:uncharacterized protein
LRFSTVDLVEVRCNVDPTTARQRLRTRESLSDADESVAARLREAADPWPSSQQIDTALPVQESVEQVCGLVRRHPTPGAVLRRRPQLAPD